MTDLRSRRKIAAANDEVETSSRVEVLEHPIGVVIGALLGGGTTAATAGLLAGPVGAFIGMVIGAAAGGLGGKAVTDIIWPSRGEMTNSDNHSAPPLHDSEAADSDQSAQSQTSDFSTQQAPREQWHHLDESNKDLIKGSATESESHPRVTSRSDVRSTSENDVNQVSHAETH